MKDRSKVLASWARVFISATLAQYISMGVSVFDLNGDMLKTIVASGVSATILVIYKYLNPNDDSYGVK